jgi:penicillin amidase
MYVVLAVIVLAAGASIWMRNPWPLLLLVAAKALIIAGAYLYLRRSLPQVEGVVRVHGLKSPVEIIRDQDFVPHIYAVDRLDAYWGLGYAHAQDRLWQMEFQRRTGQGRVSEILGPRTLTLDRFMRTLGIHRCAPRVWESLPGETREIISAYAAGVNAFIQAHGPSRLGPEFALFRLRPEPWSVMDVIAMSKLVAWNLGGTYVTELLREDLIEAVGPERARQLVPFYFREESRAATAGQEQVGCGLPGDEARSAGRVGAEALIGEGAGSNLWVVGPARSATGGAVLANDPHLQSSAPLMWYLAHLSAEDLDVIGATVPGLPGVVMGRNRHIAWGITNLNPDVQDLFRERLDESGSMAEFQGRMEPIDLFEETIKVRKGPDVRLRVRATRHGPLISDVIDAASPEQPLAGRKRARDPLALRWTGLSCEDQTLHGMLLLNRARGWEEFKEALRYYVAPSVNVGYADDAGNIGFHAAGRVPVRSSGDGSVPAEGWSGEGEWVEFIPFEEMPGEINPVTGYVVSTNSSPAPRDYPHLLGRDWVEPYRKRRITELLVATRRLTVEDHRAIQADTLSMHARDCLPLLLSVVSADDELVGRACDLLRDWDYDTSGSSVAASIFAAWWVWLPRVFLAGEVDQKLIASYEAWVSYVNRFIKESLTGRAPLQGDPGKLAGEALRKALDDLKTRMGEDVSAWRWDRLHCAVFPHYPFHSAPLLKRLFSKTVRRGGDWSTVNFGPFLAARPFVQRNIPGYRQIIDMASSEGGLFIQAMGQSGHFLSPHYGGYLRDWQAVRYVPMRFNRAAVESGHKATLRLEPAVDS